MHNKSGKLVKNATDFRRSVDPVVRRQNNQQLLELKALQNEFRSRQSAAERREQALETEKGRLDAATRKLEEAQNRLSEAQVSIDADYLPEGAQPRARIQARDAIKLEVDQLDAALQAQKDCTDKAAEDSTAAEKRLFEIEKDLSRFSGNIDDVILAKKTIEEMDKQKADRVKRIESRAAANKEKAAKEAREAQLAQQAELRRIQQQRDETAKQQQKIARKKMAESHQYTAHITEQIKAVHEAMQADRTEAVLELKDNTRAVNQQLAGRAEKYRSKVAAAQQRLEDQKDELLSKGLNPYVEFRRQELDAEAAAREKRLRDDVEHNKRELAEKLHREEELLRKQEEAKLRAAQYEQQHRAAQGRQVIEQRNERFIVSRTSQHTEVLDPSGKASRVDPSQITDIADYSFGLGKSSRIPPSSVRRITQQIREELKVEQSNYGEYDRLVSGLIKRSNSLGAADGDDFPDVFGDDDDNDDNRATSAPQTAAATAAADDDSSLQLMHGKASVNARELNQFELLATAPTSTMPGADKAAVTLNMHGDSQRKQQLLDLAVEENGHAAGAADSLLSLTSPKYKLPQLSKFERDALYRAKERHRERIDCGVEQIAGGRSFHGASFACKPPLLLFKDFEVGSCYKKTFTLTNVSYTFNSFKLLELPDEVVDFFIITYSKPGRMSAGMSCTLEIAFSPQVNKDISTLLTLLTATGPVQVPLQCLIKRCAPRVTTAAIDFGSMVIGEKTTLPLKIINTQALPTKFTIYPLYPEAKRAPKSAMFSEQQSLPAEMEQAAELNSSNTVPASATAAVAAQSVSETADSPTNPAAVTSAAAADEVVVDADATALDEEVAVEDEGEGTYTGTEPAINSAELNARVRRVTTEVVRRKKQQHPQPLSCQQQEGVLLGYSDTAVDVLCAPLTLGAIEQKFVVVFEAVDESLGSKDDLGEYVTREQIVTATTFGEEVPIYIAEDSQSLDFRCTLHERVYRLKVQVRNRARNAYRVAVKVPPQLAQFVEANPTVFFVQARSAQSVNIKFAPSLQLLQSGAAAAHFTLPSEEFNDAATVALPIEIQAANQEIPAYFVVRSIVCSSAVEISSPVIDFGRIFVGQKSTRPLSLRNCSMLPQKIAFVRLRKEFAVQPNDGFAVLLPGEEMQFEVSFAPTAAVNYALDLTVLTSFNDSYTVHVAAEGVDPPLALSSALLQLRSTPPGERVVDSTILRNNTRHSQRFQVMLPPAAFTWITVSPAVVELAAGASCRLEIEFKPPENLREQQPEQWHQQAIAELKAATTATTAGEEATTATVEAAGIEEESPLQEWTRDGGWVYASGMFGGIQWVAAPTAVADGAEDDTSVAAAVDQQQQQLSPRSAIFEEPSAVAVDEESVENSTDKSVESAAVFEPLPEAEWGICGRWNFPILVRPRKRSTAATATATDLSSSFDSTTAGNNFNSSNSRSEGSKQAPAPLFLSIQTTVTLPQIDADIKLLDFGQISLGTRQLLSFKIFNRSSESIRLKTDGLNAVGPFAIIRPAKSIRANESRSVVVECLPTLPGLFEEVLEVSAADESVGGHRIRVTLRVQGLKPVVSLEGLGPPPANWNTRSGILDFGNVLMQDFVVKRFSILNESTFAINARIVRITGESIAPSKQAALIERTASGLPIISIRPENVLIAQGQQQQIEVTFRPDRGRLLPFREDFDVLIGDSDEVLRVGVIGRARERQLFLLPADPRDETFAHPQLQLQSADVAAAAVEDAMLVNNSAAVRSLAAVSLNAWQLQTPQPPSITLVFPDPFSPAAAADSYTEISAALDAAAAAAKKGKDKSKDGAAIAGTEGARQQVKRLLLCSCKAADNRTGAAAAGSFEVTLSEAAVASKLFTVSVDKGSIAPGAEVAVDISCTLPKPRSLGGIFVGSWQSFTAQVILRGGWTLQSNTTTAAAATSKSTAATDEEQRVTVQIRAYVSL